MSRLELIEYIQQNRKNGFKKSEIRSALFNAGWTGEEIESAFFAVNAGRRRFITTLALIVITPIVGFGGAWLYTKYQSDTDGGRSTGANNGQVAGATTESVAEKASRDEQRIADIKALQGALEQYFQIHQLYPKNLSELVNESLITTLPTDPKTKEPYLYNPLGDPSLYYSLSFILEVGTGELKAGFQSVSSESRL